MVVNLVMTALKGNGSTRNCSAELSVQMCTLQTWENWSRLIWQVQYCSEEPCCSPVSGKTVALGTATQRAHCLIQPSLHVANLEIGGSSIEPGLGRSPVSLLTEICML